MLADLVEYLGMLLVIGISQRLQEHGAPPRPRLFIPHYRRILRLLKAALKEFSNDPLDEVAI
jgi:hypothetical protein